MTRAVIAAFAALLVVVAPARVFVAERRGGSWTGLHLPRSTPSHEFAAGVTARGGKATVRFLGQGPGGRQLLYARTQL